MKIAAAQINCKVGEIQENLDTHYQVIEVAIKRGVDLISFPEMSITGYCRMEGEGLAFIENDSRLHKLRELSAQGNIIIVAGAPIKIYEKLHIGSFIIYPNRQTEIYTKQYLHGEESLYYDSSMNYNPEINIGNEKIALAICADINKYDHPLQAKKNKSSIYLPSIFDDINGILKAYTKLTIYAKEHALNILMSNYTGNLWGWKSGGKSAFWNANGELIEALGQDESGLLIAAKVQDKWLTQKIILS